MKKNEKIPFEGVVGQEPVKKTLTYLIDQYRRTRFFQSTLFCAPKGQGKTTLAIETAKHLCKFDELGGIDMNAETERPRIKPLVKVNCATLTNVKAFINSLIIPYVQDKDVTVLFDEASEIPHSISMAMLDIFNTDSITNGSFKSSFNKDEYFCEVDFRKQTFLFATSEKHAVFHALANRLEKITLKEYTKLELSAIIKKGMPGIDFEKGVLDDVALVVRDNARDASLLAAKMMNFLNKKTNFSKRDWFRVRDIFNIKPLGLDDIEISVLRYLAERTEGTSLTALSAKTGLTKESLQRDHEMFLTKLSLMEIATTGRLITAKGLAYLKTLGS